MMYCKQKKIYIILCNIQVLKYNLDQDTKKNDISSNIKGNLMLCFQISSSLDSTRHSPMGSLLAPSISRVAWMALKALLAAEKLREMPWRLLRRSCLISKVNASNGKFAKDEVKH